MQNNLLFYNESMKKVINIVEDEKDLNELVKSYLEKEGYIVNSYLTFDSAYSHIEDYCDLWILDIMLDDKSGFDLIEEIRKQNPQIPVVFMSARDKEFDRIIGLEKGSDDYITKPFSPKELVLRINNIIRRVYKEDDHISINGYDIDENQRTVFKNGKQIELVCKGYDKGTDSIRYGFKPQAHDSRVFRIKCEEDRRILHQLLLKALR